MFMQKHYTENFVQVHPLIYRDGSTDRRQSLKQFLLLEQRAQHSSLAEMVATITRK